jgi:hypothetical protein
MGQVCDSVNLPGARATAAFSSTDRKDKTFSKLRKTFILLKISSLVDMLSFFILSFFSFSISFLRNVS